MLENLRGRSEKNMESRLHHPSSFSFMCDLIIIVQAYFSHNFVEQKSVGVEKFSLRKKN